MSDKKADLAGNILMQSCKFIPVFCIITHKFIYVIGYPVLRIDQLPLIESSILVEAEKDVIDLIESLRKEGDAQMSLIYYLNRQIDAMQKELSSRAAEDRVRALLEGTTALLTNQSYYKPQTPPRIIPNFSNPKNENDSQGHSKIYSSQTEEITPSFKAPIDMKSSRRVNSMEQMKNSVTTTKNSEFGPLLPMSLNAELRSQSANEKKSAPISEVVSSSRSVHSDHSDNETINSTLKRPSSSNPSRRAKLVIEENFGNAFIVGATEKKVRYYPKKVEKLTEEQILERARDSRYVTDYLLGLYVYKSYLYFNDI
jgi:hypothetical protein